MKTSSKKVQEMDYEIRFYEGVLEKNPGFVPALAMLAEMYTRRGYFQKGLEIDEQLALAKPHDPIVLYNLACSYSLLNEIAKAFDAMRRAIDCGYADFSHLRRDPDLANLLEKDDFQVFLAQVDV